eukprot:scaffold2004_cov420-Prasinococcus_capsulatus_cf.AAC.17
MVPLRGVAQAILRRPPSSLRLDHSRARLGPGPSTNQSSPLPSAASRRHRGAPPSVRTDAHNQRVGRGGSPEGHPDVLRPAVRKDAAGEIGRCVLTGCSLDDGRQ